VLCCTSSFCLTKPYKLQHLSSPSDENSWLCCIIWASLITEMIQFVQLASLFLWLCKVPLQHFRNSVTIIVYIFNNNSNNNKLEIVIIGCSVCSHLWGILSVLHTWLSVIFCCRSYRLKFAPRRAPRSRLYRKHLQTVAEDISFCAALVWTAR